MDVSNELFRRIDELQQQIAELKRPSRSRFNQNTTKSPRTRSPSSGSPSSTCVLVPSHIQRQSPKMHSAMRISGGKRSGQSLKAADDSSPTTSRRLIVIDRVSKRRFLIDTGADVCVFPKNAAGNSLSKSTYELAAANGSPISTYGFVTLRLNFGLRRDFTWRFIVADVTKAIIGADFLSLYGLLVDIKKSANNRQRDKPSDISHASDISVRQYQNRHRHW